MRGDVAINIWASEKKFLVTKNYWMEWLIIILCMSLVLMADSMADSPAINHKFPDISLGINHENINDQRGKIQKLTIHGKEPLLKNEAYAHNSV